MTENPQVVQGFIDIYGAWIERYQEALAGKAGTGK